MFCNLEANDDQLEYPVIYAAAKMGWAVNDVDENVRPRTGVSDLLDAMVKSIPHPNCDPEGDTKMLIN